MSRKRRVLPHRCRWLDCTVLVKGRSPYCVEHRPIAQKQRDANRDRSRHNRALRLRAFVDQQNALNEFLETVGSSYGLIKRLAERIPCHRNTVQNWCKGQHRPTGVYRARVIQIMEGEK